MSRIYLVQDTDTTTKALVRASNQAQAIRHVARNRLSVTVASQDDLVEQLAAGVKVEDAGADDVMPASISGLVGTEAQS